MRIKVSINKFTDLQVASKLRYSTEMSLAYKTLAISIPKPFVYLVKLNRPEKLNAINPTMWRYEKSLIICPLQLNIYI